MPANEVPHLLILSLDRPEYRQTISRTFSLGQPESQNGLLVWKAAGIVNDDLVLDCADEKQLRIRRYLDRFLLALPEGAYERDLLVCEFFEWIAKDYNDLIDKSRNIDNIEHLLDLLRQQGLGEEDTVILDFGCGTGLSRECSGLGRGTIIGYEQSPTMRRISREAGLTVWSDAELIEQPQGAIRAAFASYVLHTEVGAGAIALVVARMDPNGLFAANFHKGQGKTWAAGLFSSLGMRTLLEEPSHLNPHGDYVVYERWSEN